MVISSVKKEFYNKTPSHDTGQSKRLFFFGQRAAAGAGRCRGGATAAAAEPSQWRKCPRWNGAKMSPAHSSSHAHVDSLSATAARSCGAPEAANSLASADSAVAAAFGKRASIAKLGRDG